MPLDILTIGEALVEVMRTDIDQPLNQPGPFVGPYPSGAPFIFAVQAARLGLKTAAIGSVGADAFGECLLNQLEAVGVVTDGVKRLADQTTGIAFVAYRADGSRDFVFSLGAGGHITDDMLQPALFAGARCFHIMGSTLSMSEAVLSVCHKALEMALNAGALISFDPNLRPELLPPENARIAFAPFIAAADIFLPTETELLQLSGADGCSVFTADGRMDVAGYAVREVDPTGAGDCFDAAFISGILEGMPIREAAQLANACGAIAVSAKGPMAGAKSRASVERFMHDNPYQG